jgi:hypothetical protein
MTWHDATMAGYLLIVGVAIGLQVAATPGGSRVPSLGQVVAHIMRTRAGRIGVLTGWAWVGLHFFAR